MSFASADFHEQCRDYLQRHPEAIIIDRNGDHCLTDIVMSGEMSLFEPEMAEHQEYGRPDLVMFGKYGNMYLVELQPTGGHKRKARLQLQRSYEHLKKHLGLRARCFYVTGSPNRGFNTEEVQFL